MYYTPSQLLIAIQRQRPLSTSHFSCVKSIWHLHDETINIWTHLIAALAFLVVLIRVWENKKRHRFEQDRALQIFLPAAILFFLSSSLRHVFQNHVDYIIWHSLEHCSITIFIWASSRSFCILAYDHKQTAWRIHVAVSTGTAMVSIVLTLYRAFVRGHPTWTLYVVHTLYGSLAAIPALNRPSGLHWKSWRARKRLLSSFQAFILINAAGGIAYTIRVIGRMTESSADGLSASHYAMHMMVVIGACVYGCEVILDEYASRA